MRIGLRLLSVEAKTAAPGAGENFQGLARAPGSRYLRDVDRIWVIDARARRPGNLIRPEWHSTCMTTSEPDPAMTSADVQHDRDASKGESDASGRRSPRLKVDWSPDGQPRAVTVSFEG